ncbi:MAG: transporter substrate-binding domain-containing protein, partial [Candidatus Pacebacteria bacterium]|nr:transporter substrate-binding domain-containing protein [Candidatus Paceibacterota bacterium]
MKYWLILLLVTMIVVAAAAEDTETVRVGAYNNPPKIFTTADGRTAGIFPDILAEIAQRKGWKIDYIRGTWEQCLDRLRTGDIDLMVDVAKSSEREERFTFSRVPVLVNWGTAYVRPDIT